MILKLPGLIDVHAHLREPGAEHKEDWDSGTAAALAGGFTTVLAMPNTQPPVTNRGTLVRTATLASAKARCDFGLFIGAGPNNASQCRELAKHTAGLKMYLDQTFGPLRLDDMAIWMPHFQTPVAHWPIAIHAEGRTLAAAILMAALFNRPIHCCHVSLREEILVIRKAKEKGVPVTCEVTPHHLFLTEQDINTIGNSRAEVRPRLATKQDCDALWEHMDIIDVIATDHAPHTLTEKDDQHPPPGFPGFETALPLVLTAVKEGRITLDDVIARMFQNPMRIFRIPAQQDTWIEIDPDEKWEIRGADMHTRCRWTPFEGRQVTGRIRRVILRGQEAFKDGQVLSLPGQGRSIRSLPDPT